MSVQKSIGFSSLKIQTLLIHLLVKHCKSDVHVVETTTRHILFLLS